MAENERPTQRLRRPPSPPAMPAPETPPTDDAVPLISVIVRSIDRPSLHRALDSVAAQELPGVEVLVVDALGRGHAPMTGRGGLQAVRLVCAGRPLPRAQAANVGLDAARASRVIFLDDDDVFLPGHLQRLQAALQARPGAVAAYADVAYGRDEDGRWQTEHVFAADFDPLRLRFENFLPLHAVLVDRGRAEVRACRFDEALDLFEDWDWWLQLVQHGDFVRVPGVSARYVATGQGGSGVFVDSDASNQARTQLLRKWLARDTPERRLALLQALQHQYRSAHQAADQLALARRTEQDLQAIIAARDRDLAAATRQHAALDEVLAARDREIADFVQQLDDLRHMLAAREREVAEGLTHAQGLERILSARDVEIAHLKARLDGAVATHEPRPAEPTP